MDTDKTIQINAFTGGMDSDTSYSMMESTKYAYAENLRLFSLNSDGSSVNDNTHGEIRPIEGIQIAYDGYIDGIHVDKILAAGNIRQYGYIIFQADENTGWYVARFTNKIGADDQRTQKFDEIDDLKIVFGPATLDGEAVVPTKEKFSVVGRWEDDDNVKIYIADGVHAIQLLNIAPTNDEYNSSLNGDISKILSYPQITFKKPIFCGLIEGTLTSALVQYSYQLYKKNGVVTEVSPPSKLISLMKCDQSTRSTGIHTHGVLQSKSTGCGVKIKINLTDCTQFDYIKIYRIHYEENGQTPSIELIVNRKCSGKSFYYNDIGQSALQTLTLEEYNAMSGVHIIPKVVESKNDYLFAANIKNLPNDVYDAFKDWDSRAYQFDKNGKSYLYNYTAQSLEYTVKKTESGQFECYDSDNEKIDKIPQTADCFNIINSYTKYPCLWSPYFGTDSDDMCLYTNDGKYFGGTGTNISWKFIETEIFGDTSAIKKLPGANAKYNFKFIGTQNMRIECDAEAGKFSTKPNAKYISHGDESDDDYFSLDLSDQIEMGGTTDTSMTYANAYVQYTLKSLRRGEVYRYGIILYDQYGTATPAKWIADIRVPEVSVSGFESFISNANQQDDDTSRRVGLGVRPIGIQFTVKNLPDKCCGYEIVRCKRRLSDMRTVSQGVISRCVKRQAAYNYSGNVNTPYMPCGLLLSGRYLSSEWEKNENQFRSNSGKWANKDIVPYCCDNFDNDRVYQFVSPEVSYQDDYLKEFLNGSGEYSLEAQKYIWSTTGLTPTDITKYQTASNFGLKYNFRLGLCNSTYLYRFQDDTDLVSLYEDANGNKNALIIGNPYFVFDPGCQDTSSSGSEERVYTSAIRRNYYTSIIPQHEYFIMSVNGDVSKKENNQYSGSAIYMSCASISTYLKDTEWKDDGAYTHENFTNVVADTSRNLGLSYYNQRVFQYIKLYEQSNIVYARNRMASDPSVEVTSSYTWDPATLAYVYPNSATSATITGVLFPEQLQWDGMCAVNDKGEYQSAYQDKIGAIGEYEYCNIVAQWMYGIMPDTTLTTRQYNPIGTGGKCIVLYLNSELFNNSGNIQFLLSDTISASNVATEQSYLSSIKYENVDSVFSESDDPRKLSIDLDASKSKHASTFKDSIGGTYLCNITQSVIPYEGADNTTISLSNYYSYGDYFDSSVDTANVFDGDTFILPFDYVSMHKMYTAGSYKDVYNTMMTGYAIPVETSINIPCSCGGEFVKTAMNTNSEYYSNIQVDAASVNNLFTQTDPLYVYNTAYNIDATAKLYAGYDTDDNELYDDVIDYRCYYSQVKSNDEREDSWTKFMSANYLDVDTRYGAITNLRTFQNRLVYWQEHAVGLFSVKERTTITDDSNLPLILGTGDVLSRYDYIDEQSGMHEDQFADTQSSSTLYWFDDASQEIKAIGAGSTAVVSMSKVKNVHNAMLNLGTTDVVPTLMFDTKYNEMIGSVLKNQDAIVYNENNRAFTSIYTIPIQDSIQFYNGNYVLNAKDDKLRIAQWDSLAEDGPSSFDDNLKTYMKYIVNPVPTVTKVFDIQELVSVNRKHSEGYEDNKIDYDAYFSLNHNYAWSTEINTSESTLKGCMTLREGNYRYAIPRSGKADYGNRIRGKYMICSIESTKPVCDESLSYILTKYRKSWS